MPPSLTLLRELIAIPSVNPAFLPAGDRRAGEKNVADFLAATAARGGLEVAFQPVAPNRSNLIARLAAKEEARQRIMLAPHLDTVGEPAMAETHFQPALRQGRLHGRGACDTKGCVAAMLTALLALARSPRRPRHTEILFVGLVDEEHAQLGSHAYARAGLKADLAVVGEPTRLQLVTAHKGDLWLRFETRGKSAHGARPELGRNAVHEMARVVHLLETAYVEQLKRRRHPLLGHPTASIGMISGGTQPNIVPAQSDAQMDRRTLPGETQRSVLREIQSLLKKNSLRARVSSVKQNRCEPLETESKHPLIQSLMKLLRQKKPAGVDYFCDAAVLAGGGIPSVVFGPGDIAQAHTADEWISVASLERGTAILTRFLGSLP